MLLSKVAFPNKKTELALLALVIFLREYVVKLQVQMVKYRKMFGTFWPTVVL